MKKGIKQSAVFKAHFVRAQRALGEVVIEHRGEMTRTAFAAKAKLSTGGSRSRGRSNERRQISARFSLHHAGLP
jgi:hypothetical protein